MSDVFVLYPDPRLKAAAAPRPLGDRLRAIGAALLEAAKAHQVYGLAGAHIGQVEPVVVISLGSPESRDYRVLFNPQIVTSGGTPLAGAEGSVSLPGIEVDIMRPSQATIAYDDEQGLRHTMALDGFAARVAQHEIEQMNGVFFLSHLSRLKRDTALRRYEKSRRERNSNPF